RRGRTAFLLIPTWTLSVPLCRAGEGRLVVLVHRLDGRVARSWGAPPSGEPLRLKSLYRPSGIPAISERESSWDCSSEEGMGSRVELFRGEVLLAERAFGDQVVCRFAVVPAFVENHFLHRGPPASHAPRPPRIRSPMCPHRIDSGFQRTGQRLRSWVPS